MNLVKNRNGLKLVVPETLMNGIAQLGIEHHPNEFGGFLVGKYSDDFKTLYINNYILPKKYKGHPCLFERSTDGLQEKLENLFVEKNQYYIGEWHTHPDSSTQYSQTDLIAMNAIAHHEKVNILNPILLILSVTKTKLNEYKFYFHKNNQLLPYE